MTEHEAAAIVEAHRRALGIPADRRLIGAERMIVEAQVPGAEPVTTVDRIAWLVSLADAHGVAEVAVDDEDGRILFVRRRG